MPDTLPESPLPPCPGTPNCTRQTRVYERVEPDALFEQARATLHAMGASTVILPSTRRAEAVFRVFLFKDDVLVAVDRHAEGAVLHIRSASRVGRSDLGVNKRRVLRFFRTLGDPMR